MNVDDLVTEATKLEERLRDAIGEDRVALHAKLHRSLDSIRALGGKVPAHLRELDLELIDEEVEDSFDNMPV